MVRRINAKPIVQARHEFAQESQRVRLDIEVGGVRLTSEPLSWLIPLLEEIQRASPVPETLGIAEETITKLTDVLKTLSGLEFADQFLSKRIAESGIKTAKDRADRAVIEDARRKALALAVTIEGKIAMEHSSKRAICLACHDASDARSFALYRGTVWSCSRELEPEQWRILVDAYVAREDADFARALGSSLQAQPENRDAIPSAVRRAVWIRDAGRCARCGGRERLEYDHIIPVSKGGSSTERNIELLCEACNRSKSDEIR